MSATKNAMIEVMDAMEKQDPLLSGDDIDDGVRFFQLSLIVYTKAKKAGQSIEEFIAF